MTPITSMNPMATQGLADMYRQQRAIMEQPNAVAALVKPELP